MRYSFRIHSFRFPIGDYKSLVIHVIIYSIILLMHKYIILNRKCSIYKYIFWANRWRACHWWSWLDEVGGTAGVGVELLDTGYVLLGVSHLSKKRWQTHFYDRSVSLSLFTLSLWLYTRQITSISCSQLFLTNPPPFSNRKWGFPSEIHSKWYIFILIFCWCSVSCDFVFLIRNIIRDCPRRWWNSTSNE